MGAKCHPVLVRFSKDAPGSALQRMLVSVAAESVAALRRKTIAAVLTMRFTLA
jgi:hypothetical protein